MSAARRNGISVPAKAPEPLTPEEFTAALDVSRETLERLKLYAALLVKWQKSINLVGPATLPDLWRRHFLDSAQLHALAPDGARVWLDLGSGAGFPGLVLAIMGAAEMHLVESDSRKAIFMQEVLRETGTRAVLHRSRIEALAPFTADVITARALAPLPELLDLAAPFMQQETVCLLQKGQDVGAELTAATKCWKMHIERLPSRSDASGSSTILRLQRCQRV